jgi:hypothetical protein
MVRETNWSRRLPHSVTPLDGERMIELRDIDGRLDLAAGPGVGSGLERARGGQISKHVKPGQ